MTILDCQQVKIEKKRIALLGGTFDPPHWGHVQIAKAALQALPQLSEVIFVPAGLPALKNIRSMTPSVYRYQMTKLLVRELPHCRVSDLEVSRPGPSYTLTTVKYFLNRVADRNDLYFVAGYDVLFDLPRWHKPGELLQSCTLLIGTRPGYPLPELMQQKKFLEENFQARILLFEMEPQPASSTAIRDLFNRPQATATPAMLDPLLPRSVADFCRQYELYQTDLFPPDLPTSVLEQFFLYQQKMWFEMSFGRLLHSVSTAMLALRLALRFKVDPAAALLSGLLHDLAKEKDGRSWLAQHPAEAYWLQDHPPVIHGAHGAELAQAWGLTDPEALAAIRYHTTLRAGATDLEKIIFLADKIEYGRTYQDLEPIRRAAEHNLDEAVRLCLASVIKVMQRRRERPHPFSLAALQELQKQL